MKPHCNESNLKAAHMFQHDHHECTCATLLKFTYITLVYEVLLLVVAIARTNSKMSIVVVAGDWNVGERARLRPDV